MALALRQANDDAATSLAIRADDFLRPIASALDVTQPGVGLAAAELQPNNLHLSFFMRLL